MHTQPDSIGPLQQDPAFTLSFRLREAAPAQPKALVVLLHGVGGNETNLAGLAASFGPDVLVVLARGPLQFAPGQYGWFRVAFTARGPVIEAGEAEDSRQALLRFITQLQTAYKLKPRHTLVTGFSQGGILSASVALSEPEQVGAFAILSGRILPELDAHLASRERLANLRAFISHGEYDSKLPVFWAQRASEQLDALGVTHVVNRYPADHELSPAMQADFLAWANRLNAPTNLLETRYAAARAGLVPGSSISLLEIGHEETRILSGTGTVPDTTLSLAIGAGKTSAEYFRQDLPTPVELENAIQIVEDEIARARNIAPANARLVTWDAGIHAIAVLAGLPDQDELVLSRNAVEQTFERLTALALGRPASGETLPASKTFAARLLILREFMHHQRFASITIRR
ncbi:MAG: putative esterase [Proteobacteria bacterium]|nr:putative esterase [Pseudomonadota bacterium]